MIINIDNPELARQTLMNRGVSEEKADKFIEAAKLIFETEFEKNNNTRERKDDNHE